MNGRFRAGPALLTHLALLVVQIAFASQAVESKIAMNPRALGGEEIPAVALAMARMVGAALFFQLFARAVGALRPVGRADQAKIAGLSILGIAMNQGLFLVGLRFTTPMSAALLGITIPVITAAMSVALRHERASVRMGLGLLLAAAGVAWLTGVHSVDRGAVIIAINCIGYSSYIVLSRRIIQRLGALTVVTWAFTWATFLFAPVGALSLAATLPALTPRGTAYLAYIVVVPTIVAYLFNAWALGRSTASLVTVYIYVQPILTAALAWVQLGQALNERLLVASAFIAVGVGLVSTRRALPVSAPS